MCVHVRIELLAPINFRFVIISIACAHGWRFSRIINKLFSSWKMPSTHSPYGRQPTLIFSLLLMRLTTKYHKLSQTNVANKSSTLNYYDFHGICVCVCVLYFVGLTYAIHTQKWSTHACRIHYDVVVCSVSKKKKNQQFLFLLPS